MVEDDTDNEKWRADERSGAGKTRKAEEIKLVVARSRGHQLGGRGSGGVSRLLAQENELASWGPGIFLSGLPELWRQAPVRRENLQCLWFLSLQPERTHPFAKVDVAKVVESKVFPPYRLWSSDRLPLALVPLHGTAQSIFKVHQNPVPQMLLRQRDVC